jgi:hypothetical protein
MKVTLPTSFPRCRICKKPLKNSVSAAKGVGPECATKFAAMLVASGLTLESLGIPESIATKSPMVARWLDNAKWALLRGRKRDMEHFKAAAIQAAREAALAAA